MKKQIFYCVFITSLHKLKLKLIELNTDLFFNKSSVPLENINIFIDLKMSIFICGIHLKVEYQYHYSDHINYNKY